MKKLFIAVCLIFSGISFNVYSQTTNGKVFGTVIDGNAKVIESASINLLNARDSSVIKLGVADKTGRFVFENIAEGRYFVSVSAVGHQKGYSDIFEITSLHSTVTLKTIELIPVARTLTTVSVAAKKPLIEQKIDRTVVNVEAAITNVGSTALEVLEKSPGITVDKDGNISLKGKSGVQLFIDGRPTYLSGADLANLLRNMNANQLDQIEIMTNPPAKFDAEGNSGVINIKTKKNRQFGLNGSFTAGYTQGWYARFNESANLNYRNGKVNLFGTMGFNRNHRGEKLYIHRKFREQSTKNILSIFDQESDMTNEGYYYNIKTGMDIYASRKTTLGFVLNGYYNPGVWESHTHTEIFDPYYNLLNVTKATSRNDEKWKNFGSNFNLRHVFDSTGKELTADFDYILYRSDTKQPLISSYYDNQGHLLRTPDTLMGTLPQNIDIYSAKTDYSMPFKNGAKLEAGLKSSYVKTDNNASYDTLMNGEIRHDYGRSNHFVYQENINAAYISYSRPLSKKWKSQVGLRLENTHATGDQLTTGQKFKRNYTQLFPTAYAQYTVNEKNQLVLHYGRRVNRPNYADLNPFILFLDRYTFEQGNPDLKPQFSHNIELSHTYLGFLTSTLNYSSTHDIIQQVVEQNENTNETFVKKANIARRKQVGISVSGFRQISKWWSGNFYLNLYNNRFKGIVNNEHVRMSITGLLFQTQQQFKWGKGWGAELSGFYRTKGLEGVIFLDPIAQVSAGISKQVLNNKGTIKVNFRDIFAGAVYKGEIKYGNVDASFRDVNDSRSVSVAFTWRFNKGTLKTNGNRKTGGAAEEMNRVQTGN
jgi:iron complex outermembrane receptor protein